jgi:hypothetical protein
VRLAEASGHGAASNTSVLILGKTINHESLAGNPIPGRNIPFIDIRI